ncbi:energy transducer TonB [Rhodothalassium salexigens]|uniref:energy transducer TonB n=1 Tax=Rhodothalassium salexigens TaxID=1086 RepID=UPI001912E3E2|nr:energy transducer TonB [Rhodothalassium salexigens]
MAPHASQAAQPAQPHPGHPSRPAHSALSAAYGAVVERGLPVLLGAAVTLALLVVMTRLVMAPDPDLSEARAPVIMDFTKVELIEAPERRTRQLPPPPSDTPREVREVRAEPQALRDEVVIRPDLLAPRADAGLAGVRAGYDRVALSGFGAGSMTAIGPNQDRYAQPLVRVSPIYPMAARIRKITGYVLVEFDVTREGAVANARVIGSEPVGLFDKAALEAIQKWRYKPKLVDGTPQPVPNMLIKLTFDQAPDADAAMRGER